MLAARLAAAALLVPILCALPSCGSSDGGTAGPATAPPAPSLTDGYAASRDAFAAFAGKDLAATTLVSVGADVGVEPLGVRLTLGSGAQSLRVEIVTKTKGVVAGPFEMQPDPGFTGGFRFEGATAFGASDLVVRARVRTEPSEIDLVIAAPKRFELSVESKSRPLVSVVPNEPNGAKRQALLQRWDDLVKKEHLCNDLARFAVFVQDIVDTNLGRSSGVTQRGTLTLDVTRDLADLFVPNGYSKELIMLESPKVARALSDPPLSCADQRNLTGFADNFRKGEGRFRHFSANAAADAVAFGVLVNIAARLTGGDFEFLSDPTGDIAADLATNAIGRAFANYLENDANLESNTDVRDWIIRQFGGASPDLTSKNVVLDEPQGPHAAGATIGLCRMRGCHLALPDECPGEHVHDNEAGVTIDDQGPYPEPVPPCGYGKTTIRPAP